MSIFSWIADLFKKDNGPDEPALEISLKVSTTTESTSTRYNPQDENVLTWVRETYVSVKKSKKSPKNYTVYRKNRGGFTLSRHPNLHNQDSKLYFMGNLYEMYQNANKKA
jgi:hypothetical protein